MPISKQRPIRTAPINKSPSFILAEPIRSLDRIQLSIENRGYNYELILETFRKSMEQINEARKKHKDGYKIITTFKRKGLSVYVTYYGGYWFSVQVMDPDDDIQILLQNLISEVVPLDEISLSQVEFALDFYPVDESTTDKLFETLSNHAVLKGIRARHARRIETTHYQGPPSKLHSGPKKLTVYLKPEHGHWFTRVELEAHKELLKRHQLDFGNLPLSPTDIEVLDYVVFRQKIDLNTIADRVARSRMLKSKIASSRRRRACFLTLRSAIRNVLANSLRANPLYEINELTAAEQICLLKENLSPRSSFVFCLERHFPAFPKGRCGNVRWKA